MPASQTGAAAVQRDGDACILGPGRGWDTALAGSELPLVEGYRILRVVGHGGMSTVYLAEQESLGRKVALKVMLAEALADEVSRARFENEARIIARLEHPNIVGIHEVGRTADGLPFYSMPYLPRGHLAQRRLAGDQPRVMAIVRNLLQALDYAHVRGIVHRDVKAENVLFDDADRPLLADFGIALRRGSNPRLTNAGLAVGSTAYMPPEQARGHEVDRRADLYSIGVLTWETLTGRLPYNAGDALSMALKHVQDPIPRLPPTLKHWQGFIDQALAKKPEDRFTSAQEMLDALDAVKRRAGRQFVAVEPPLAMASDEPAARRPFWQSGWLLLALSVLAIVAISLFLIPNEDVIRVPRSQAAPIATPAEPPAGNTATATDAAPVAATDPAAIASGGLNAYLANAEQQLREGRLLAPPNANAWDSLDAAWRVNATHPQTQRLTARLFDALAEAADRDLRAGDTAGARLAFQRAQRLDSRRGGTGSAIALLRKRLDVALEARFDELAGIPDRQAALRLLADARALGLDDGHQAQLQARANALADAPAQPALRAEAEAAPRPVTLVTVARGDYARFAAATARAPADCGRTLFGRRRSWDNTGSDRKPVACVSAADALAYADWRSLQEGRRYRLPSVGEARSQAAAATGWLTLCADRTCSRRAASGKPQPLDASRGYDDVGILLVREE